MPEAPHTVELRVGGELYSGWTGGSVRQSLDQFASAFSLEFVDRWAAGQEPWPIFEGDLCQLRIDDEVLLDGFVDEAPSSYDADTWDLSVSGRSRLGDLVDCDAVKRGSQWLDAELTEIVLDLCRPFDVGVFAPRMPPKFRRFKFDPGDKVADVIMRAARLRGMMTTDFGGHLELFQLDPDEPAVAHLEPGYSVLRGGRSVSWADRFSEYRFRGQTQADDKTNGVAAARLKGTVRDEQIDRYRPMLVLAGDADGDRDLGLRAILERNQRAGRSERISYMVPGFRHRQGGLWRPGQIATVTDPFFRIEDERFVVVSAAMAFGPGDVGGRGEGMVTELELTRPEAYGAGEYPLRREVSRRRARARAAAKAERAARAARAAAEAEEGS